jgi:hypothetical protein
MGAAKGAQIVPNNVPRREMPCMFVSSVFIATIVALNRGRPQAVMWRNHWSGLPPFCMSVYVLEKYT